MINKRKRQKTDGKGTRRRKMGGSEKLGKTIDRR